MRLHMRVHSPVNTKLRMALAENGFKLDPTNQDLG